MPDFRIFKYTIDLDKRTQLIFPHKGAKILSVQVQRGECQLWALVDASQPEQPRRIEVLPTGAFVERANELAHLATVQIDGGSLVFHLFERIEP